MDNCDPPASTSLEVGRVPASVALQRAHFDDAPAGGGAPSSVHTNVVGQVDVMQTDNTTRVGAKCTT